MNHEATISKDKSRLHLSFIHQYLTQSYWAKGRTISQVKASIAHSMCYGLYVHDQQIGFGRVISDRVVFAYMMDVFVTPAYQKKGLGKKLVIAMLEDPELAAVRTWHLKTKDANEFYAQFGFEWMHTGPKFMIRT